MSILNSPLENTPTMMNYYSINEENYKKLKRGQVKPFIPDIMKNFCRTINNNEVVIDFKFFKFIASNDTYLLLIQYINDTIQMALMNVSSIIIHINLKSLSITDIDKHQIFIKKLSESTDFIEKISRCNIYNAGYIFSTLINAIFIFLNSDTRQNIKNKLKIIE